MYWNPDKRRTEDGFFECAVERRERSRARYDSLSGMAYNLRLLQMRRASAVYRRKRRAANEQLRTVS